MGGKTGGGGIDKAWVVWSLSWGTLNIPGGGKGNGGKS